MREISIIKARILQYLEYKGISKYESYQKTGITNGVFSQANGMSEDNLLRFLNYYTDLSADWLILGIEPMIRSSVIQEKKQEKEEKKEVIRENNSIKIIDNSSIDFILDRYEALVSRNTLLEKEIEELKQSRGKSINTVPYTDNSMKIATSTAAEPTHK